MALGFWHSNLEMLLRSSDVWSIEWRCVAWSQLGKVMINLGNGPFIATAGLCDVAC